MLQNLTGWHALIILGIVILIFGAAKLPALARSVGQSLRILKAEAQTVEAEAPVAASSAPDSASANTAPASTAPAPASAALGAD
ncbi:twin-arginine translocase TatA/TatE family subunit [Microbacterium tenebrionis]|uniref:twin-arginine translocase TatA/TatE family subunit n=1 Tax=Microbacterium tenebrionis TaxID=2830665 RepID=UPI00158D1B82|nr:twin-arginine translocase TatA/TatE family subunit [Microbacterium ihumii]